MIGSIFGPWGIIASLDVLKSVYKSWGHKPFIFKLKAVYFTDGFSNPGLVKEICSYFGAQAFSEIDEFCNWFESGYVLNLSEDQFHLSPAKQNENITILEDIVAKLIWDLIVNLEEQTLQREIFFQVLNSTAEGIQIADTQGLELFINKSLLAMLNVKLGDRRGVNIYNVSPGGGLAHVLKQKVPVKGLQNINVGTNIEFISNAEPIYINGEFYGAVTFARDITEISRLSKELEDSKHAIACLNKKVGHLASAKYTFDDFIGTSPETQGVINLAQKAAERDLAVLIQGESGTGKEILAQAIHNYSSRKSNPFIPVNCAAIPEQLLESEFFGYEKGAFTSASTRKLGLFDLANTGTIFLDEIGDMNLNLQSKLLRVLQDKEFFRVGGRISLKVDVRVVAATHRDLSELIREGKFREDLFYRLNVINIKIPSLRERLDDLEEIANFLIHKNEARVGGNVRSITREALTVLKSYHWPGNIRELENILERTIFLCQGNIIRPEDIHLPEVFNKKTSEGKTEKEKIKEYLLTYGYSVKGKKEVAKRLNMSLATLYNKIKFYDLNVFYLRTFK